MTPIEQLQAAVADFRARLSAAPLKRLHFNQALLDQGHISALD